MPSYVTAFPAAALGAPVLELDGSHGEGGGQIIRTSLFLSLLTGKPFTVQRIRAGRSKPGLKAQHVSILRLLSDMTGSTSDGASVGSTALTFQPGAHKAGAYAIDIGTAGCIPLVLQTVLPVAIATPGTTRIEVTGGTHVPFGPTIDWLRAVYLPYVAPLADIRLDVPRIGFAPQGGGRVVVDVSQPTSDAHTPDGLRKLVRDRIGARRITQGKPKRIAVRSVATRSLGRDIARRQALAAFAHLSALGPPQVDIAEPETDGPGSSVTCSVEDEHGNVLAADRLGNRGTPAETVGRIAGANLVEDWKTGATVDRHMGDHVAPWVALGAGAVRVPQTTLHLTTNAWVCEQFLGQHCVRADRNLVR